MNRHQRLAVVIGGAVAMVLVLAVIFAAGRSDDGDDGGGSYTVEAPDVGRLSRADSHNWLNDYLADVSCEELAELADSDFVPDISWWLAQTEHLDLSAVDEQLGVMCPGPYVD